MAKSKQEPDDEAAGSAETVSGGGLTARLTARIPGPLRSPKVLGSVLGVVVIGGGILWWSMREGKAPPDAQLTEALELLKNQESIEARQQAQKIGQSLRRGGYRDPDFAGGVEFVLGIVAFRNAMEAADTERERNLLRAVRYLRECEQQALTDDYRPEWSYALGASLHELGNGADALPLLREAVKTFPPGRFDSIIRLTAVYLDRKQPSELSEALTLIKELLKQPGLTSRQTDRIYMQKAQLHVALNQHTEAQISLKKISNAKSGNQGTVVFRAQTQMASADALSAHPELAAFSAPLSGAVQTRAQHHYQTASDELQSIANSVGLDTTFPRQASYLLGVCAEKIGRLNPSQRTTSQFDRAIADYERTARSFPKTHEAVVASLRSGELLRNAGRDEEALQSYRRALEWSARSSEFHNRWLTLEEFQAALFRAWNDWRDRGIFQQAIELSRIMAPIVPRVRAQELNAVAHGDWADQLEREINQRPSAERKKLREELLRRRRLTGQSYGTLAELVKTTTDYPKNLQLSADNYHRGHDFETALKQNAAYIKTRPKSELAPALVQRGQILLDLDRLQDAKDQFQQVLDAYPNAPDVFPARYQLATCLLESGDTKGAEAIWRKMLSSGDVRPIAREWRLSLFSLGRHLFHTGRIQNEKADQLRQRGDLKNAIATRDEASAHWQEAVRRLEEYVGRYPQSKEAVEARFLVAKSLQHDAQISREKLDEAEVDNVKNEHRRRMNNSLRQARDEYRKLQSYLLKQEEADQLEDLGKSFLRDTYFEIAHAFFALEEFDKAIVAYNSAANRYPEDPQILLAYLQMANCNDRLGDKTEALSLIVQAEVILKQLPDKSFQARSSSMTKAEWKKWLQWAKEQHVSPAAKAVL